MSSPVEMAMSANVCWNLSEISFVSTHGQEHGTAWPTTENMTKHVGLGRQAPCSMPSCTQSRQADSHLPASSQLFNPCSSPYRAVNKESTERCMGSSNLSLISSKSYCWILCSGLVSLYSQGHSIRLKRPRGRHHPCMAPGQRRGETGYDGRLEIL